MGYDNILILIEIKKWNIIINKNYEFLIVFRSGVINKGKC